MKPVKSWRGLEFFPPINNRTIGPYRSFAAVIIKHWANCWYRPLYIFVSMDILRVALKFEGACGVGDGIYFGGKAGFFLNIPVGYDMNIKQAVRAVTGL